MSYWPAIIEWGFWLVPYLLLFAVVSFWWDRIISLRGYNIRSIATFVMAFVVAYALGNFREDTDPWRDPMWLLAMVGMVALAGLAMNADRIRAKFAEFELQLGRKSGADRDRVDDEG